ncbi:helix-turn-helix domain-containing protein [Pedobacter caeni]|uniref:Uncharacterized protein n=1 Tax=Pedobacter caeni TaxID=288992 RepID=A0A1M5HNE3_9SPHI|nr:response regulator transcription factor [Pedobacter caeni]SHG17342.1 hypothetical protein SAMN04488522_104733 [Pedobacter caeni]
MAGELEILHYFAKGLSITYSAEQVHISKHTIVAHWCKMTGKPDVNPITE